MATYPSDATANTTAFSTLSSIKYTNTGVSTVFNLAGTVEHRGEVVAFVDGIQQPTTTYAVSNGGATVTFNDAPSASNLTLTTLSLPPRYRLNRSFPSIESTHFSNTSATVVNGNTYLINGQTQNFPLPADVNGIVSKNDIMVFISGVQQNNNSYTFPATNTEPETTSASYSRNLGYQGISVGESEGTVLLLNFGKNFNDESVSALTPTVSGSVLSGTSAYGNSSALFDGTNDSIVFADNAVFDYTGDFTVDCRVRFDGVGDARTIFSHRTDASNYVKLSRLANNKIQFKLVASGSNVIDLQGGSISAGTYYHVNVSNREDDEAGASDTGAARLYIDGTLIQEDTAIPTITLNPTGTFDLGKFNSSEFLDGFIDSFRFVNNTSVYDEAFTTPPGPLTAIHSPLGLTGDDTLDIRTFQGAVTVVDRFASMEDRKPDTGYSHKRAFDVVTFESQAGYEKRRLRSRRSKRDFDLSYTNVTGVELEALERFYKARSGTFESFDFDLTHINESGTIRARFEGTLDVSHIISAGPTLPENFYTIKIKLKEVYD